MRYGHLCCIEWHICTIRLKYFLCIYLFKEYKEECAMVMCSLSVYLCMYEFVTRDVHVACEPTLSVSMRIICNDDSPISYRQWQTISSVTSAYACNDH